MTSKDWFHASFERKLLSVNYGNGFTASFPSTVAYLMTAKRLPLI